MIKGPASVPRLFAKAVIKDIRFDCPEADARAIATALGGSLSRDNRRLNEAVAYYALCERAWLHWSRSALDSIATHVLRQPIDGDYKPPRVRTAEDAAAAHGRCALHLQLLDVAFGHIDNEDWTWRLEAARHVTSATQKALAVAARLDPHQLTSAAELSDGVAQVADALLAAIRGGFIADPASEARATMRAIVRPDRIIPASADRS